MKPRLILGIALLATLLVSSAYLLTPPRVEAQHSERLSDFPRLETQQAVDAERGLSGVRKRLVDEYRNFEEQTAAEIRDLDARQDHLKLELDRITQVRASLERSLEQRQLELQKEIQGLKSSTARESVRVAQGQPTSPSPKQDVPRPKERPFQAAQALRLEYRVLTLARDDDTANREMANLTDDGWDYAGIIQQAASQGIPTRVLFKRVKK